MANSNNWGEIYKFTWWGDKAWSANTLFIDSAPPGFGLNLLKGSEDLDNTIDWDRLPDTTDVPTVSANVITDPNGGTTAERVDFSANRQARLQQRVTLEASKQYTFSVYAKVNTGTQNFRLRNVTLRDAESKTATTSWTRFSYTFTTTTAGDYDLSLQNNDNTARTLEFWGAMLNEGATAGDYVQTEASVSGSAPTPAYSGFGDAFGGVTAYYSLRQFTEAETLNAIRVRRSSDDTEQDIGFDSNGDLDTTALTTFVNEDVNLFTSDYSSGGVAEPTRSNFTVTIDETKEGKDECLKAVWDGTSPAQLFKFNFLPIEQGVTFDISAEFYLEGFTGLRMGPNGNLGDLNSTTNDWATYAQTITVNNTNDDFTISLNGGTSGSTIWLKNIVITQTTADGAVTTFYDQSGNGNDATNSTESEQPLVVSGGALVTENGKAAVDFDGVDDYLQKAFTLSNPVSHFVVAQATNQGDFVLDGYDVVNVNSLYTSSTTLIRLANGATMTKAYTIGTQAAFSSISKGTDSLLAVNGSSTTQALSTNSMDGVTIGAAGTLASGYNLLGTIQEVIIFDSDQSSNRTGIEGNIDTYFDIV